MVNIDLIRAKRTLSFDGRTCKEVMQTIDYLGRMDRGSHPRRYHPKAVEKRRLARTANLWARVQRNQGKG